MFLISCSDNVSLRTHVKCGLLTYSRFFMELLSEVYLTYHFAEETTKTNVL